MVKFVFVVFGSSVALLRRVDSSRMKWSCWKCHHRSRVVQYFARWRLTFNGVTGSIEMQNDKFCRVEVAWRLWKSIESVKKINFLNVLKMNDFRKYVYHGKVKKTVMNCWSLKGIDTRDTYDIVSTLENASSLSSFLLYSATSFLCVVITI